MGIVSIQKTMKGMTMKIIREGKEIELTPEELYEAYKEQQEIYDTQNIENNMVEYLDSDIYEQLKNNAAYIEEATDLFRSYLEESEMSYEFAVREAIRDTAKKYIKS